MPNLNKASLSRWHRRASPIALLYRKEGYKDVREFEALENIDSHELLFSVDTHMATRRILSQKMFLNSSRNLKSYAIYLPYLIIDENGTAYQ